MNVRQVTSKIYGNLGEFQQVQPNLCRSASGRVYLLGNGRLGGKGEGIAYLDKARETVQGYEVPRSLILCDDFSGLPHYPVSNPPREMDLDPARIIRLMNTINDLGFNPMLAIRSSAQAEDQIGHSAAGIFHTEFHGKALDCEESIQGFVDKLQAVYHSAYSERAVRFWEKLGYFEIPPMSAIIQELVGQQWEYAPRYFLPAISGIVNTSSRNHVKVATVIGLGLSAVGDKGLGILDKIFIDKDGHVNSFDYQTKGEFNSSDLWCIDSQAGGAVNLTQREAERIYPAEALRELSRHYGFPQTEAAMAGLTFEKAIDHPVDLEWASKDGKALSLVQIRPIAKKALIAKPEVTPENIILSSKDMFGQIERAYDHIIYLEFQIGTDPYGKEIKSLSLKYPHALFIYSTSLTRAHNQTIIEDILPYTDALIVQDSESDHVSGTGMQHLSLSCRDEKKGIIYIQGHDLQNKIRTIGTSIERAGSYLSGKTTVFKLPQPVRLAADDEAGWAMLYFAGENK